MSESTPKMPKVGCLAGLTGWLCIVWGFLLWLPTAFLWLRFGATGVYPTSDFLADRGWAYPHSSWIGIQKILDWVMAANAGAVLFVTGLGLLYLGGLRLRKYDRELHDHYLREDQEKERQYLAAEAEWERTRAEREEAKRAAEAEWTEYQKGRRREAELERRRRRSRKQGSDADGSGPDSSDAGDSAPTDC